MELASKSCRSYEIDDASLDEQDIHRLLNIVEDWVRTNHRIQKHFHFNNFMESIAFVNAIAAIAEAEDHHPDITISWNQVILSLTTHAVNGLSENDFILAAKIDQLARSFHTRAKQTK